MPCTAEFFLRPPQPRYLLTHGFLSRVFRSQQDHYFHTQPLIQALPCTSQRPPSSDPSIQPAAGASAADFQNDLLQQQASTSAQHLGDFQQHRGIAPLIFLKPVVVSPAWRGLQAGNTDLEAGASRAAERSGVGTVPTCLYRGPLNRALTTHH